MAIINPSVVEEATRFLAELAGPVRLVVFTHPEAEHSAETRQLVEEVAALSERITVEVFDLQADPDKAAELAIDKAPAIAIIGAQDYGVRFYGVPAGYEFTSLMVGIRAVAAGTPELEEATLEALAGLETPVHIQVFVTPTCPYCPPAVILAHQMAIASPLARADMVEAMEFPALAAKYQVMGVPRTVINDKVHIEGAAPEPEVLARLQEAARL
jgi:glutaredoxin-like protein